PSLAGKSRLLRLHQVIYGGVGSRERTPGEPPGHVYSPGRLLGDRCQDALSMRVGEYLGKLLQAVHLSTSSGGRLAGICGSHEVTVKMKCKRLQLYSPMLRSFTCPRKPSTSHVTAAFGV